MRRVTWLSPFVVVLVAACKIAPAASPADQYWTRLSSLCDQTFEGTVVEAPAGDTTFARGPLLMQVRSCSDSVIRIPFHVGENRSRTWVITRTAGGFRLKHDHRHADGTPDAVTDYGGDSRPSALTTRVEFPADSVTRALIPAAARNVWTVGVDSTRFVYALRREGTERRFRVEFDLTRPVPAPPAPWGADDAR